MAKFSLARWLEDNPRFESLMWASPYLLFILVPLGIKVYDATQGVPISWAEVLLMLLAAAVYVASWLLNPVAPQQPRPSVSAFTTTGLFLALQIFYSFFDSANAPFFLAFLASMVSLQFPNRWVLPMGLGIVIIATVQSWEASHLFAPITIIVTAGLTFFIRHKIEFSREQEIETIKSRHLASDQHRNRLAADLHDILGQSLTTINVKAQLAQRLLEDQEGERVTQAGQQVDEIAQLARLALDDVRKVVTSTKEISVESELVAAQELLGAADITVNLKLEGRPNAGILETNAAYVIREACANIIHHSATDTVDITLNESGVRIYDHGPAVKTQHKSAFSGSGLAGLKDRIGSDGVLVAQAQGRGWLVDYTVGATT